MNQQQADKIGHLKREVSALNKKVEQKDDLIKRLTRQNAELQYDNREMRRVSGKAFETLRAIETKRAV